MYTSGTTGKPKGAIRNHEGSALISLVTALDMGFSRDDTGAAGDADVPRELAVLRLHVHLPRRDHRRRRPQELRSGGAAATLAREHVTFTSLVPTHYIMMLGLPDAVKATLRRRARVAQADDLVGAGARDTKLAILEHFRNSQLYELYGSSEAGWVTLLRPDEQIEQLGLGGREWTGSGAIKILDPDGNEVPDGEVGELFSRTPYVFDGYWKNPEKTAEAFRGEWCSVGDMARRDDDGYIHLVDRKSNMIISGGENIYPSEVEAVLGAHPRVKDVAVVGVPHEKWGEAVHAVVVLHERQPTPTPRPSSSTGAATRWPATSGRARSRSSPTRRCRARPPGRSCTACCAKSSRADAHSPAVAPGDGCSMIGPAVVAAVPSFSIGLL